ncbi:MAG: hypothetical protein NT031_14140 [Planctomycetota bacterium]|nr:hypothetical protein [Planctomycetota bacterium]
MTVIAATIRAGGESAAGPEARALSRGQVHVWVVRWDGPAQAAVVDAWEELLDDAELARCRRLGEGQARRQYVAAHGLVRQALSRYAPVAPRAWRFAPGPGGKPRIVGPADGAGIRFNLSHTHGLAACAVAGPPATAWPVSFASGGCMNTGF